MAEWIVASDLYIEYTVYYVQMERRAPMRITYMHARSGNKYAAALAGLACYRCSILCDVMCVLCAYVRMLRVCMVDMWWTFLWCVPSLVHIYTYIYIYSNFFLFYLTSFSAQSSALAALSMMAHNTTPTPPPPPPPAPPQREGERHFSGALC